MMRRMMFGIGCALAMLCLGGGAASAEEGVALKQLAPGTVFNYVTKSGGPVKVTIKSMNGVFIQQEEAGASTDVVESVAFSIPLSPTRSETMSESDRAAVRDSFQLKVGNVVKTKHKGETRGYPWTCSDRVFVSGVAKVTVPAGTYDTYLIESAQRDMETSWRGDSVCWYSPEVGTCVKVKWRSSKSNSDWELESVALPAAQ
jgi:hypothetical protein